MKKIILIITLLQLFLNANAQSLLKENMKSEPEALLGSKINEQLRISLNYKKVPECYTNIFAVRFELSEKSNIQNVNISASMTDTLIIGIINKILNQTSEMWDLKKCKQSNPTMAFLLPVKLSIFKDDCNIKYGFNEVLQSNIDFTAMIKFQPTVTSKVKCLFCPTKEKFVGIILNPIVINNGDSSH